MELMPTGYHICTITGTQVCVIESADVMLIQNWQHVVSTLDQTNRAPKKDRGTDFSRLWAHLAHGQVSQTFSYFAFADMLVHRC